MNWNLFEGVLILSCIAVALGFFFGIGFGLGFGVLGC